MYDYITPQNVLDALSFLKANNPLYADIDVNTEWLKIALANDAELCKCLVEQQNDGDSADPLITAMRNLETQASQNYS